MEGLTAALAKTEKEKDFEREKKQQIKQKAYNEIYRAHESGFNQCLYQVMCFCEVLDNSIFDIDKWCV